MNNNFKFDNLSDQQNNINRHNINEYNINRKHRKNKKIRRILSYILLFVIPIAISVATAYAYNYYNSNKTIENKNITITPSSSDSSPTETTSTEPYYNELPTARETYGNQNIMGKIEIPNMNINAYVTRTVNNSYYLNYNLYNVYDQIGVPFFDYRNTDLNNDKQINIYGHNTQNSAIVDQLPFTNLERYTDQNVFNTNKDIYLYIDERKVHYEVIAIKIITTDIEHMKVIFSDDNDFITHTNKLLSDCLYLDSNTKIKKSDRLLVLQICHYDPEGSYLLVIAKEK